MEYMKTTIYEIETNSKIKKGDLCKEISEFKKSHQPRNNKVKDEKGDLVTGSHCILARWRNHFSQLCNVYGVNEVRQT